MLETFEIDFFSLSYLYERVSVLARYFTFFFNLQAFRICKCFSSCNVVFLSKLVVVFKLIVSIFQKMKIKNVAIIIIRTVHEQGGCLVLSSCFNVLYFTKVNRILPVRVVGLLFMSYVTE